MIKRTLCGIGVSAFALGTANFGGIGSARRLIGRGESEKEAHALLDCAVDLGINLIDTAGTYADGASETFIGSWLASRRSSARSRVLLTSKVGVRGGLGRTHVMSAVEHSLRRLRVETIDFYLAHVPDPSTPWEEVLDTFAALVESGKVRYIGLSNVSAQDLFAARSAAADDSTPRFRWVQNPFNLLNRDDEQNGVLESARALALAYTPYSPLAGGLLSGKYAIGGEIPAESRIAHRSDLYAGNWNDRSARLVAELKVIAAECAVSAAGLAAAWAVHRPFVTSIILGGRTVSQLEEVVTDALEVRADAAVWSRLEGSGGIPCAQ